MTPSRSSIMLKRKISTTTMTTTTFIICFSMLVCISLLQSIPKINAFMGRKFSATTTTTSFTIATRNKITSSSLSLSPPATTTTSTTKIGIRTTSSPSSSLLRYQREDDNINDENLSIHNTIFHLDPDWYKEYVIDILGEEFCKTKKWPVSLSSLSLNDGDSDGDDTTIVTNTKIPSTPLKQQQQQQQEPDIIVSSTSSATTTASTTNPIGSVADPESSGASSGEDQKMGNNDVTLVDTNNDTNDTNSKKGDNNAVEQQQQQPLSTLKEENGDKETSQTVLLENTKTDKLLQDKISTTLEETSSITPTTEMTATEVKEQKQPQQPQEENPFPKNVSSNDTIAATTTFASSIKASDKDTTTTTTSSVSAKDSKKKKGSVDSFMASTLKEITKNVFDGNMNQSIKKEEVSDTKANQNEIMELPKKQNEQEQDNPIDMANDDYDTKNKIDNDASRKSTTNINMDSKTMQDSATFLPKDDAKKVTMTMDSKKQVMEKTTDNDDNNNNDDNDNRVVVYRSMGGKFEAYPITKLTTTLGYRLDEIQMMQSDALSVIVQDEVNRPRFGVPSQWKIRPDQSSAPQVQIMNLSEATEFLQEQQQQQQQSASNSQSRRQPPSSSSSSSSSKRNNDETATTTTPPPTSPERRRERPVKPLERKPRAGEELDIDDEKNFDDELSSSLPLPQKAMATDPQKTRYAAGKSNVLTDVNTKSENLNDVTTATAGASDADAAVTSEKPSKSGNVPPTTTTTTTTTTKSNEDIEQRTVVYRNMRGELASVPLKSLTKLGYQEDDIKTMLPDALTVVIEDEVPRPRMGVPPQWKINKNGPAIKETIQIVDSAEQGQALVEADKTENRRKKAVETESIVGRPRQRRNMGRGGFPKDDIDIDDDDGDDDDGDDDLLPRRRRESESRRGSRRAEIDDSAVFGVRGNDKDSSILDESSSRRKRRNTKKSGSRYGDPAFDREGVDDDNFEKGQSSTRGAKWRNSDTTDDIDDRTRSMDEAQTRRRRRQRSNRNADGTPKKVYNARELLGRTTKSNAISADPPSPNSRIWVDMDTFRDLLRAEAGFRLKILGDDWAPTIKQESDWRLNLYKSWLWTLHNGVGESIVPPSRYERARTMRMKRAEDEEATSSARPKRRKKQVLKK